MFRFNQTRFRNYLTIMKYFDGISVDNVVLSSTGKNRTAALYCIVIVYELLFLASLQWQHFFFVLYKKIKILQCVAYQLSPLTAPFVCGQMCICVCSFIIIAAIGLMFAVFNRRPSFFFSFATSSFTFHLIPRIILFNWKNLFCNAINVCESYVWLRFTIMYRNGGYSWESKAGSHW